MDCRLPPGRGGHPLPPPPACSAQLMGMPHILTCGPVPISPQSRTHLWQLEPEAVGAVALEQRLGRVKGVAGGARVTRQSQRDHRVSAWGSETGQGVMRGSTAKVPQAAWSGGAGSKGSGCRTWSVITAAMHGTRCCGRVFGLAGLTKLLCTGATLHQLAIAPSPFPQQAAPAPPSAPSLAPSHRPSPSSSHLPRTCRPCTPPPHNPQAGPGGQWPAGPTPAACRAPDPRRLRPRQGPAAGAPRGARRW